MIIKKLREPKLFGFVLFDWISTILAALLISHFTNINGFLILFILLALSVFLHYIFKIDTKTNYYLGLSNLPVRNSE